MQLESEESSEDRGGARDQEWTLQCDAPAVVHHCAGTSFCALPVDHLDLPSPQVEVALTEELLHRLPAPEGLELLTLTPILLLTTTRDSLMSKPLSIPSSRQRKDSVARQAPRVQPLLCRLKRRRGPENNKRRRGPENNKRRRGPENNKRRRGPENNKRRTGSTPADGTPWRVLGRPASLRCLGNTRPLRWLGPGGGRR